MSKLYLDLDAVQVESTPTMPSTAASEADGTDTTSQTYAEGGCTRVTSQAVCY